ncbi:MAG: LamG-like jellyroll fold domain-containing protein [Victivallales bacterium]|jgi:hypothetical protein
MIKSLLCKSIIAAIICCGLEGFSADLMLNLESKDGKFQDTGDNKLDIGNVGGATRINVKNLAVMQIPLNGRLSIPGTPSLKYLSMGKDSMTLSAMVRITGTKGHAYVMCNGAGSYLGKGYRLGAMVTNGKINFYLLLVAKPFAPDKYNKVQIDTDAGKRPESGTWIYVTAVVNRENEAVIHINGEVVGRGSIAGLAQEDLASNYFYSTVTASDGEPPCEMSIACITVNRGLISSVEIRQNAEKWLEVVKE